MWQCQTGTHAERLYQGPWKAISVTGLWPQFLAWRQFTVLAVGGTWTELGIVLFVASQSVGEWASAAEERQNPVDEQLERWLQPLHQAKQTQHFEVYINCRSFHLSYFPLLLLSILFPSLLIYSLPFSYFSSMVSSLYTHLFSSTFILSFSFLVSSLFSSHL